MQISLGTYKIPISEELSVSSVVASVVVLISIIKYTDSSPEYYIIKI